MFTRTLGALLAALVALPLAADAGQASSAQAQAVQAPPPMVPMVGTLLDEKGQPVTGQSVVTISIYAAQTDPTPLWQERQLVTLDARGQYSITLGSVTQSGVPTELFADGVARWLGIQPDGLPEQARFLLTSVPYALKSGDANTLGGLPASAFMLSGSSAAAASSRPRERTPSAAASPRVAAPTRTDGVRGPLDQVIPDDLIVQGSACVGLDCVNGETFNFSTLRLKENNTRIHFNDTSAAPFPGNDWVIRANSNVSGGPNFLGFVDQGASGTGDETGTIVFEVDAGAPANALKVDSNGKVGLRTASPALDLHFNTSDTPALRFEQNGSGGFTAQTWDVAGNEANFFVRDVTGGSRLPFRIRPGAPTSSIDINAVGNVGIGTQSPNRKLHVASTAAGAFDYQLLNLVTNHVAGASFTLAPSVGGAHNHSILSTGPASAVGAGYFALYDEGFGVFRLLVSPAGDVTPGQDGSQSLGTAPKRWSAVFATNGTIQTSDARLKKSVTNLGYGLQQVMQLRPVSFQWNDRNDGRTNLGLIAQEVDKVIPEAVERNADPAIPLGLNYSSLVPVLIKAVQEQQALVQAQQAMIADLQARLATLESASVRSAAIVPR